MKYVKVLGLAAVAAMTLMAFLGTGTAAATTLCQTAINAKEECDAGWTWPEKTTIGAALKLGTKTEFRTTNNLLGDECLASEIESGTTNETGASVNASVNLLRFGGCTSKTAVLKQTGTLAVTHTAGTNNGAVSGTGLEITVTIFGESCVYGLGTGTALGSLEGGAPAHITVNAVVKLQAGSGVNCPTTTRWTATYILIFPEETVDITK